tara:strand:- start:597 stop:1682 length:1086 start_codon:yes stop_codon:yes gene_type:complete
MLQCGANRRARDRIGERMTRRINLALQGGGAHGAFTWGVLDRLLEEDGIEIAAISGTSAGALNGAALKSGLVEGGRAGARARLDWLWGRMGAVNDLRLTTWMSHMLPTPGMMSQMIETALPLTMADFASRMISPYMYGPAYRNPLEYVVRQLDFDGVCAAAGPALFVSATNVRTGKIRVFADDEINTQVILASACLPTIFQAVELTDPVTGVTEAYWDGGYTGNPALFPLFAPELPSDIMIVNINPLYREAVPVSAQDIQNRINEISFNTSLLRELRAIEFVQRLVDAGTIPQGAMKRVLTHMIADDDLMTQLSVATKLVPTPAVLFGLKARGRAAMEAFLAGHMDDLNERETVNLREMFG